MSDAQLIPFGGSGEQFPDYVQEFACPDMTCGLQIITNLDKEDDYGVHRPPPHVPDWTSIYQWDGAPGTSSVTLTVSAGAVTLAGDFSPVELKEIGTTLRRVGQGVPGWRLEHSNLALVHEGWETVSGVQSVYWRDGHGGAVDLVVGNGVPSHFFPALIADGPTSVEVQGHPAIAADLDGTIGFVVWSPQPDVTVTLSVTGSRQEALSLAGLVHTIDQAELAARTEPVPTGEDGCIALVC